MGIHNLQKKIDDVVSVISNATVVATFTDRLGSGPALHFYRMLLESRRLVDSLDKFLSDQHSLELCYGLPGLWGMDTRAAHMPDGSFSKGIGQVRTELLGLEAVLTQGNNTAETTRCLGSEQRVCGSIFPTFADRHQASHMPDCGILTREAISRY
jgi:hypothetical protein